MIWVEIFDELLSLVGGGSPHILELGDVIDLQQDVRFTRFELIENFSMKKSG